MLQSTRWIASLLLLGQAAVTKSPTPADPSAVLEVSRFGSAIEILPGRKGKSPTLVVGDSYPRHDGVHGRVFYFELSTGRLLSVQGNPISVADFGSRMTRIGDVDGDGAD